MITVHHLNNSRSQRVLWLLEELELEYEVKRYQRDPKTMLAPPSLRAIHPLGKSPVITDGDSTVAESGAIIEYLIHEYGGDRLKPPIGSKDAQRYTYWMHYAEGSAMPPLLMKLIFGRLPKPPMPAFLRPFARLISGGVQKSYIDPQLVTHLNFMEAELGKSAWFAGDDFSAADIQMSFPLEAAHMRAGLDSTRPRLMAYLQRIHARPAYLRAIERGGKYDFMQ